VTGNYAKTRQTQLLDIVRNGGGDPNLVEFSSHLTDAELADLYRGCRIVVVPSVAEGFSIPPIEANANGAVVLVSDTTAHPELLPNPAHRFGPHDHARLSAQLERLIGNEAEWGAAQAEQADMWIPFTLANVGHRFWSGVSARGGLRQDSDPPASTSAQSATAAWVHRDYRPSIAVVTPLPPVLSGVADYSARFLEALSAFADVHVFTSSLGTRPQHHFKSFQSVSSRAYVSREFERTVTIIGNSVLHLDGFRHLLDYGGACVAHDARMIDFYYHELGPQQARALARRELGRSVALAEVTAWLHDQSTLECLFLSEICERANPLFVHSRDTVRRLEKAYGAQAILLPFALYGPVGPADISREAIAAARARLGVADGEQIIASFGIVSLEKAPSACVEALAFLRDSGVAARLVFCGYAPPTEMERIAADCRRLRLEDAVTVMGNIVPHQTYRDWLLAADVAIQLRNYGLGGLSGALNDCIGAALPTVANASLAANMRAPAFISRIDDALRPVDIAGAVSAILKDDGEWPAAQAAEHARLCSFDVYCRQMLDGLGFHGV
jgi:glycosyltransferase involved in cell wall biosynthesis